MAHNLLGSRFYNRGNVPAWHGLGITEVSDKTAEEVVRQFGIYGIQKMPLKFVLNRKAHDSGYFALVRDPIPEDNEYRVIGTPVSGDFEVSDPLKGARLWDAALLDAAGKAVPIETIGFLGKGERMFVTTKLPTYDVRGDEVATYLLYDSPFTNNVSIGGYTTGVRVVCQNTLNAAVGGAVQQFQVTHSKGSAAKCADWIKGMYSRALMASEALSEAYNVLASKPVNDLQIKWIVDNTYRLPAPDVFDSPNSRLPLELRQARRDTYIERVGRIRREVYDLYNGKGTGMDTPAVQGTAFGAYNAVAEFETYRRGGLDSTVQGLLNGGRALRIRNAFELAMNVDHYQTADVDSLELPVVYG